MTTREAELRRLAFPSWSLGTSKMRAARRLVNLATQSLNPYFAGISIGWPGRSSWTVWPTNRTANGVGRSNFKIGPTSARNPRPNPKANFEIGTPDPNFKPSPPKERLRNKPINRPHPNHTTNKRQYYLSCCGDCAKNLIVDVNSPA